MFTCLARIVGPLRVVDLVLIVIGAVLTAVLLGCGASTAPKGAEYGRYVMMSFAYQYREPGYSEGLDSLGAPFVIGYEPAPGDGLSWSGKNAGAVIGYFWAKYDDAPDTLHAAGLVWPSGLVLRGQRIPAQADSFELTAVAPPGTWVTGAGYGFHRFGADTLVYARQQADSVASFSIVARFARQSTP